MMKPNRVEGVRHIRGYTLWIRFADGSEFELDFEPMLQGREDSLHAPLRDPGCFKRVALNGLTLEWPTGLDICPDGLRAWCEAGRILADFEESPAGAGAFRGAESP